MTQYPAKFNPIKVYDRCSSICEKDEKFTVGYAPKLKRKINDEVDFDEVKENVNNVVAKKAGERYWEVQSLSCS